MFCGITMTINNIPNLYNVVLSEKDEKNHIQTPCPRRHWSLLPEVGHVLSWLPGSFYSPDHGQNGVRLGCEWVGLADRYNLFQTNHCSVQTTTPPNTHAHTHTHTHSNMSAHTEQIARGLWEVIPWIWQKVYWIRITDSPSIVMLHTHTHTHTYTHTRTHLQ